MPDALVWQLEGFPSCIRSSTIQTSSAFRVLSSNNNYKISLIRTKCMEKDEEHIQSTMCLTSSSKNPYVGIGLCCSLLIERGLKAHSRSEDGPNKRLWDNKALIFVYTCLLIKLLEGQYNSMNPEFLAKLSKQARRRCYVEATVQTGIAVHVIGP